ncbi:MAG TPA: flagellar biosynthetic protein FliO [Verrucomicrobiae bacterium]|nr:flagellar biosynthetic protein FliO [Verrucomicrobiae bacterium]
MESVQQILAVLFVLGLLGGTLLWLRGKGMVRFTGMGVRRSGGKRMQSLERLPLTPQHSLHLISVSGRVLLIAVSPGGCTVLDGSTWDVAKDLAANGDAAVRK